MAFGFRIRIGLGNGRYPDEEMFLHHESTGPSLIAHVRTSTADEIRSLIIIRLTQLSCENVFGSKVNLHSHLHAAHDNRRTNPLQDHDCYAKYLSRTRVQLTRSECQRCSGSLVDSIGGVGHGPTSTESLPEGAQVHKRPSAPP
ncbi:hypothetical protein EW146_g7173 [Bondarzewia mesenterica]|uniref:Uncharacterized protein n=1 Tax=Bondarzewia mesenterica TaxID=1095465 RepID=A0A4S4LNC5_9AGAM|nr:hypothetical protein EW146_g7173 [Bondarzewia mesenterica]